MKSLDYKFDFRDERNLSLVMDFYELTMSQCYFNSEARERIVTFDLFYRKNPDNGGYAVFAGLEEIIGYIQNPLLMGDNQNRPVGVLAHTLKYLDQVLEAPQVNPRFRFIEHGQLGSPGQHSGDLDPLQLAAGQAGVDLAVYIILCTEAHFGKISACLGHRHLLLGSQPYQIQYLDPFKTNRLLEREADSHVGPLCNIHIGNILPIEQNPSAGRLLNSHNQLGRGGLSASVGTGNHHEFAVVNRQA